MCLRMCVCALCPLPRQRYVEVLGRKRGWGLMTKIRKSLLRIGWVDQFLTHVYRMGGRDWGLSCGRLDLNSLRLFGYLLSPPLSILPHCFLTSSEAACLLCRRYDNVHSRQLNNHVMRCMQDTIAQCGKHKHNFETQ